jgi:isopenicillin-N epimerase
MIDRRTFLSGTGLGLAAWLTHRSELGAALARLGPVDSAEAALRLRDDYLLAPGLLYLNHGSIGTIPRVVMDAYVRLLRACETNPHIHMWDDIWTDEIARTRERAARLVNAQPDEVALTHNTTEGFNVLAQGLPLGDGDEVLFSSLNHLSASEPWRYYAKRRDYTVRDFEIPLRDVSEMTVRDLVELHAREIRPSTRVLVFPHIDNLVGVRHPIRELTAMAQGQGVEFVAVDIAQSLGMIPVDFEASGADFFAASPHKWVQAPKGSGLLVVRSGMRERLDPLWVKRPRHQMPPTAVVFEDYSTRNLPAVVALGDALEYQLRIGPAGVDRRLEIAGWFRDRVEATPSLTWRSPRDRELASSLFAIEVARGDARTIERRLSGDHGIVVRPFAPPLNSLRVSPNLINTPADADRFIAAAG